MAQIGNYIHYHFQNYLKYGTARKIRDERISSGAKIASFDSMITSLETSTLAASPNMGKAQQLEDALNYFCNTKGSKAPKGIELSDSDRKMIENFLLEQLKKSYDIVGADFERTAIGKDNLGASYEKNLSIKEAHSLKSSEAGESGTFYLKWFEKRVDDLMQIAKALNESIEYGKTDPMTKKAEALKAQWESLKSEVLSKTGKVKGGIASGRMSPGMLGYSDVASFQEDLVKLGKEVYAAAAVWMIEGKLAEDLVAVISYVVENKANLESANLLKILENRSVGTTLAGRSMILKSDFDTNVLSKMQPTLSKSFNEDYMGYSLKGNPQGKVDVNASFGQASVKNYYLNSKTTNKEGVSLVTGANLFNMLAQEPLFLNHYLNVAGDNVTHTSQYFLQDANRALKRFLTTQAIAGLKNREKTANLFVINDKATGRYRVYAISDLLKRCREQDNLIKITLGDREFSNGLTWQNTWVGRSAFNSADLANQRIANLLSQLLIKVSVSIHPNAFI